MEHRKRQCLVPKNSNSEKVGKAIWKSYLGVVQMKSPQNIVEIDETMETAWYQEYKKFPEWVKEDLRLSAINVEKTTILPISVTECIEPILGFSQKDNEKIDPKDVYVITYPDGSRRIKIRGGKYLSPLSSHAATPLLFYTCEKKELLQNHRPLYIVEGEKKAICLQQNLGKPTVSIPGVTMWRSAFYENKGILSFNKRSIRIFFDRDIKIKPAIQKQAISLFLFLYNHGANDIAFASWDEGKGIDDFFYFLQKEKAGADENKITMYDNPLQFIPILMGINGLNFLIDAIIEEKLDKKKYINLFSSLKINYFFPNIDKKTWEKMIGENYSKKIEEDGKSPNYISAEGEIIPAKFAEWYSAKTDILYDSVFYKFNGRIWEQTPVEIVEIDIIAILGKKIVRKALIQEIIFFLERECRVPANHIWNADPLAIAFKNGVFDVRTKIMFPHEKKLYQTVEFDVDFSLWERKPAPNFDNLLSFFGFDTATVSRLQEWFGYCLVPTTKIEKCLFLKGEGQAGKSTLLEALNACIGTERVACLEPDELQDKFKLISIKDKLVNIGTDVDKDSLFGSKFKKLVTGEETTGENKHKDPIKFRPFCKFIFAANDYVLTKDRSTAFYRRFDVIEFKKVVQKKDLDLKQKIKAEKEGIIFWAMEGLLRLISQNWEMTESNCFAESKEQFERATNPLKQFLEETTIIYPIRADALRVRYREWCEINGFSCLNSVNLGKELSRLGIEKKRGRDGSDTPYFYYK